MMEITVKLFAMLGSYLPPGGQRNQAQIEIADDTTVTQLIEQLNLPIELTHLVLVNGIYVEPHQRDQTHLSAGDEFVVFPPIAGG
jgi:sulfur carrier protein ThiS